MEGHEISFAAQSQTILEKVSFQIKPKEHVVLVGPSGQGKSVFLKILAGLLSVTDGKLLFEGENWRELSITQRNRHYLKRGMLFQRNALFDSLSVRENLLFPIREVFGSETQTHEKKALEILAGTQRRNAKKTGTGARAGFASSYFACR
jgi:phospholipid/cholesterol/gamma-HCH transport system ATP-binding protein